MDDDRYLKAIKRLLSAETYLRLRKESPGCETEYRRPEEKPK